MNRENFILMTVGGLTLDPVTKTPIVVLRDRSGAIRGFFNTCRHRGAQLCADGAGRAAKLVCPYHQWTYDLDGRLLHAGQMPESAL